MGFHSSTIIFCGVVDSKVLGYYHPSRLNNDTITRQKEKNTMNESDFLKPAQLIWEASDYEERLKLMSFKYFQKDFIEVSIRKNWSELDKTSRSLIAKIIIHKISQ